MEKLSKARIRHLGVRTKVQPWIQPSATRSPEVDLRSGGVEIGCEEHSKELIDLIFGCFRRSAQIAILGFSFGRAWVVEGAEEAAGTAAVGAAFGANRIRMGAGAR